MEDFGRSCKSFEGQLLEEIKRILTLAVTKIRSTGIASRWYEITNEVTGNIDIMEYVYAIDLENENVRIIIFSSVPTVIDKYTRDSWSDMIRVGWEISTKKKNKIYKIAESVKRIENLENNLMNAILLASRFQDNKDVMSILNSGSAS